MSSTRRTTRKKIGKQKTNHAGKKITSGLHAKKAGSRKRQPKKSGASFKGLYSGADALVGKLIEAKRIRDKLERLGLREIKQKRQIAS